MITANIPWNHKALEAEPVVAVNMANGIERDRKSGDLWRIVLKCDRMEQLGFFNLAQGREPNERQHR